MSKSTFTQNNGGGGTQIVLTANEDLVAGQTVGIASNLENQAMKAVLATRSQTGPTSTGSNSTSNGEAICEISPNKYAVVLERSDSPYGESKVFIIELDEDTMTFTFGAISAYLSVKGIHSIAKIDTDKFIISSVAYAGSADLVSTACSVSGLTVTVIGAIQVGCIDYDNIKSEQLDTNRVALVVSKRSSGGAESSELVEVSLSGATVSYGTFKTIIGGISAFTLAVVDTNKVALVCAVSSSGSYTRSISIATVSAGVWTLGTPLTMAPVISGDSSLKIGIASYSTNEVYVSGQGGSNELSIIKYSTTTATPTVIASGTISVGSAPLGLVQSIVTDGTNIYLFRGSIVYKVIESGSVLNLSIVTGLTVASANQKLAVSSSNGYYLMFYSGGSTLISGNMVSDFSYHIQGMTNLYTGIVQNTVSRGGSAIVKISGIDGNQTGLIPGATYEPSAGGLIPSTGLTPYTLQATSSTEVNI